jgi:hypothetical protein
MLVNEINLANGKQLFLLDKFFPPAQLAQLEQLCDAFTPDSESWTQSFSNSRWVYNGTDTVYQQVVEYLSSTELTTQLSQLVGRDVHLSNHTLWLDVPGFGSLKPHRETGGEFLAQVFITKQFDNYNGTTFYTDDKNVLFQMPYRNNFAWLFEGTQVLHGRQFDVAPGLKRFSIMMWYNTTVG